MGEAKWRRAFLASLGSEPIPESGLFLLSTRSGVSVVVAARPESGGAVAAAMFCVDEWKGGLFQCRGRRFDVADPFCQEIKLNGAAYKPSDAHTCQMRVAWGLGIRRTAGLPAPEEFEKWERLIGSVTEAIPTVSLYGCPECGSTLPADIQKSVLSYVGKNVDCYMVCERCTQKGGRHVSLDSVAFPHRRRIETFEKAETFSLNPAESGGWMMSMPEKAHHEAIEIALKEGGPVQAAAFAIETWIIHAARPNADIKDDHIRHALQDVLMARTSGAPLEAAGSREVKWVRDAAVDGLSAFDDACAGKLTPAERAETAKSSLEKILDSLRLHENPAKPTSYIEFVSRYIP